MAPVMKKSAKAGKNPRKPPDRRKQLIKALDAAGSEVCRIQWNGRCGTCRNAGTAQHHFFGKHSGGFGVRWDTDNLIWLCFTCHFRQIHDDGKTEPARDAIIKRIGSDRFNDVKKKASQTRKYAIFELEAILERLNGIIEKGVDLDPPF